MAVRALVREGCMRVRAVQYRAAVLKAKSLAVAMRHRAMESSEASRVLQKTLDDTKEKLDVVCV